jgi:hypothetical protein
MRTYLYHKDVPGGRIFESQSAVDNALKGGWVEAPWLINQIKIQAVEVVIKRRGPKPKKGRV